MIIYRKATINDDTAIANLLLERLPRDPLFVILGSNMTLKKFVPLMIKKAICLVAEEKISSRIIGVIILQNKNVNNFYFLKTIKIKDFFTIFFNSIKRKSVLLVLNAILFSIINLKKPGNLELLYIVVAKKMDRKNIGTCLVSESVINVQEECILWVSDKYVGAHWGFNISTLFELSWIPISGIATFFLISIYLFLIKLQ